MTGRSGCILGFVAGTCVGGGLLLITMLLGMALLPHWLVVDQEIGQVEAIIVLGGGGGDRLQRGVELQEACQQIPLVLVGRSQSDWLRNSRNCRDCDLTKRPIVYLSGSVNTISDAQLVRQWCIETQVNDIVVVTDPYHTRRAQRVFSRGLRGTDIKFSIISSGTYAEKLAPDDAWWRDRNTLETVWEEFGKIIFLEISPFFDWLKDA